MKSSIAALSLLGTTVAVAVAAAFHPLNVKTGWWQMAETVAWTGLPPQIEAAMANGGTHEYHTCVKPQDLRTNPWAEGSQEKCTWTVINSTGTDMEVKGTSCSMGSEYGLTAEVHGKIHVLDSQDGTGSFDITMSGNGQNISGHATYTGKWVGSTCAAE